MLRKKWLSLLVAVSMVAAMMPTTAFAAEGDNSDITKIVTTEETDGTSKQDGSNAGTSDEGKSKEENADEDGSNAGTPDEGESKEDNADEGESKEDNAGKDESEEDDADQPDSKDENAGGDESDKEDTPVLDNAPVNGDDVELPEIMVMSDEEGPQTIEVKDKDQLIKAVENAKAGDTIVLAEGEYNVGTLRIDQAVNIQGAGKNKSTIVGNLVYTCGGDSNTKITVSKVAIQAPANNTTADQAIEFVNGGKYLDGAALTVSNVKIVDFLFGIGVNSFAKNCTLDVRNLTLDDVWCGANVSEGAGNAVKGFTVTDGSSVVYEIQVFGGVNASVKDAYYETYEACTADPQRKKPTQNGANLVKPSISDSNWPAVAEVNGQYYGSLVEAVAEADLSQKVTVNLVGNVTLTSPVQVPEGAQLVVNGNGYTIELSDQWDTEHYGTYAAFNNTSVSTEGLGNASLTVNNVKFKGHTSDQADHAVIVGSAGGATVNLSGCTFTNMYDAVYCNFVSEATAKVSTIKIDGCTFDNVAHSYGLDNGATTGALNNMHKFTLSNNTNEPTPETFAVALVGNVGYDDLAEAVAAAIANGETVKMQQDVVLTSAIQIPEGANVVINGNGHTIQLAKDEGAWKDATYAAFNATGSPEGLNNATLTVNKVNFVGHTDGMADHAVIVGGKGGATVKLSGCSFKNLYDAVYCNNVSAADAPKSTITITGSSFDNVEYSYAVDNGGTSGSRADAHVFRLTNNTNEPEAKTFAVAVVNGVGYPDLASAVAAAKPGEAVELKSDVTLTSAIQIPEGANVVINGNGHTIQLAKDEGAWKDATYAAFNATGSPEGLNNATLTVNKVNFVGHTDGMADHAVIVGGKGGATVKLSGCSFKNLYDAVYCNNVSAADAPKSTITITGSSFDNVEYSYALDDGTPGSRTDAHTFRLTNNTNEPEAKTFAVAVVNGTVGYPDVASAVAAAKNNDTVKLMADSTLDSMMTISQEGLTLDLNGHTISGSATFTGTGNDEHLVDITANNVTIKGGTLATGDKNTHALNVYSANGIVLQDVKLDSTKSNGGTALVVNSSDVTLKGNVTFVTGKNCWGYAVNVDSKVSGKGATLTLANGATATFEGKKKVGIYIDNTTAGKDQIVVKFNKNSAVNSSINNLKVVELINENAGTVVTPENANLVLKQGNNGVIDYILGEVSSSGSSSSHNYQWQYNADKHWQLCSDCGSVINEGTHNFQWKQDENGVGYQQCADCGYRKSATQTAAAATNNATASASASASTTTAATATAAIPQTSDASNPLLWVVLLVISGSAFGGLMVYKKKKENC